MKVSEFIKNCIEERDSLIKKLDEDYKRRDSLWQQINELDEYLPEQKFKIQRLNIIIDILKERTLYEENN